MVLKRVLALIFLAASASAAVAADDAWEKLPDGSAGMATEFQGVGGVTIPAYMRKPSGTGPFPVVVCLHGGKYGRAPTFGLGRSMKSPIVDFVKEGWAIYSIDYRPNPVISIEPIETDDCLEAVKTVRKLPFIDPTRVGFIGASHGGNVASRLVSRVDAKGAILCAPAAFDLIEVKRAAGRGEPVVSILKKLIADMEKKHGASAEEIEKDPAKYKYSSAMTEAAEVRCPILIINARNDDNSPASTIDALVAKLKAAGKDVQTYLPAVGGHGFYFGNPDIPEWKESTRLAVAFFRKQFGTAAATPAAAAGLAPLPAAAGQGANPKKKAADRPLVWVDPDRTEPEGTKYKTFPSRTINADVSYLVYLPPDYDRETTKRYPVLYTLHGSGGMPTAGAEVVKRLDTAIRAGKVEPLIVILVNGLRGNTMYCDSRDGKYPLETVFINDMIPYVDSTYRTIAAREGRAIEGFSMGGFGAAHYGFKYPELFGVVSIQAPALLGPELTQPTPAGAWSRLFPSAMGSDLDYFRANDPFSLIPKNADALRDRTVIRIVCHVEKDNWLGPQCEKLHKALFDHMIPHHFLFLSNVKSHDRAQVLDTMGDAGLMFLSSGFASLQKRSGAGAGR
jgi:dipeptidyl aminopeptidase/acylaminoacyl peptidase